MIGIITLIATSAFGQTCENTCVDDLGDFAVSQYDIIGIDQAGHYLEVDGGWADTDWSFVNPYTAGITFSELEGSPKATEWGCGILATYGYVGNVACWGWTADDEVKNAPPPMTDPADGSQWQSDAPYAEMDISLKAGCAIGSTGTILAWSYSTQPKLEDDRPTAAGYTQCAASDPMMCAVGQTNGGVDCWGSLTQLDIPAPTTGTYTDVSCRSNRWCFATQDDGTLDYFGDDGELTFRDNAPTATNLIEVHTNERGAKAAVARDSDGYVWAWQYDTSIIGAVDEIPMAPGAYSQRSRTRRTAMKFSDVKLEYGNVCGLISETYSGDIECSDASTQTVTFVKGDLVCWGTNSGVCAEVIHPSCPSI